MMMPDECNFDSLTHAQKIQLRVSFRGGGVDLIIILCKKSETTLDFAPVRN